MGTVFLLTLVYFGLTTMSYGLSMFMPAIIKSQSGVSSQMASFLATVPFVMALLAMLLNGFVVDGLAAGIGAAIVTGIVSWIAGWFIGEERARPAD